MSNPTRQTGQLTRTAVYSGALDIVLSLLPWKIVWNVAINKKEKIGALIAMSFGVLYVVPLPCLFSSADQVILGTQFWDRLVPEGYLSR